MTGALDALRVLDLSTRLAGAYCARLFGDFGADVRMLETERGHPLRGEPPFLGGEPGPERSLLHAYVNANKTSWLGDGEYALKEQIAGADVIVTTEAPWPERLREALRSARPDAVVLSITPFGLEGPLAGAKANNLTLSAMSGWSSICGYEGEPPLTLPRHSAEFLAGVASFCGGAAALLRREATGQRTLVDVSELEAMIVSSVPWSLASIFDPGGYTEAVHKHDRARAPFLRAADGDMVVVLGQGPFWRDAMTVLGIAEPAELAESGGRRLRRAGPATPTPGLSAGANRGGRRGPPTDGTVRAPLAGARCGGSGPEHVRPVGQPPVARPRLLRRDDGGRPTSRTAGTAGQAVRIAVGAEAGRAAPGRTSDVRRGRCVASQNRTHGQARSPHSARDPAGRSARAHLHTGVVGAVGDRAARAAGRGRGAGGGAAAAGRVAHVRRRLQHAGAA